MNKYCVYSKFIFIFILLTISILFSSCNNITQDYDQIDDNQIYLYHRYSQKIVKYSPDTKKITLYPKVDNLVQYEFSSSSNIYTSGHSTFNNFEIIKNNSNNIETLFKLNKDEGIFPLATNNKDYLFIHTYYSKDGDILKHKIAKFDLDKKELYDYPNIDGFHPTGIILDNDLYFTRYEEDKNNYTLLKMNYLDLNSTPEILKENLETKFISYANDKFWIIKNNKLISENDSIDAGSLNYFHNNFLIQIGSFNDTSSKIIITNINNKDKIYNKLYPIDFIIDENQITIYGNDYIDKVNLYD